MRTTFLAVACFLLSTVAGAQVGIDGLWDAVVVTNKVEIPFRFEIERNGSEIRGFFFEGDRKIASTGGSFENGTLKLDYDFLNTKLEATLEGDELRGTYRNNRASDRPGARPLEFRARHFVPAPANAADVPQVAGNWEMKRTAQDRSKLNVSWKLYLRQSGPEVSGAILKTSGDSGLLTGQWKDGKLVMSHFAGERPLRFEGELNPDGTLAIILDGQYKYVAARTAEARAKGIPEPPDPSRFTSVKDPAERFHFSAPDVDGKIISDKDERFRGKVVLVVISGTWCPNCHDEAPFLVDLYREFHARGLEIVGLNFEFDSDLALARPHVLTFNKRYGIEFPMLVPGTPEEAAAKLPQLTNFAVYPTTIFLGRDGKVRSVQAGFASAATGEEHVRRKNEERKMIEQLLEESSHETS